MTVSVGALQATEALESLLQPCFGPNGLDVLLERADGHAGCINSGVQLLNSLTLSHPVGLLLSRAIKEHHLICGDGSKKMVLMLAAVFREIHKHCLALQLGYGNPTSPVEVSQALQHLRRALITVSGLNREAEVSKVLQLQDFETVKSFCSRIMDTGIGNGFSYCIRKRLKDITMAILFPDGVKDFNTAKEQLHYCQNNLHSLTNYLPGVAVAESQVFPGFIIDRDFINPPLEGELCNFRFLLLMSGLEWEEEEARRSTTVSVSSADDLKTTVDFFSRYLKRLVECTYKRGIRLVLCGGGITPVARQLLQQHKIAAIQMVSEETLQAISEYTGVYPVVDTAYLPTVLADVGSHPVGLSCSYVMAGQRRFVHLTCLHGRDSMTSPHSILLSAPTTGLCRQLTHRIGDMLRIISCYFKQEELEGQTYLVGVAGGGACEISLVRKLESYILTSGVAKDSPLWIAVRAFQKGLLAIPQTLLTSSLSQAFTGKLAAEFHHAVLATDKGPLGVDCLRGNLKAVDSDWSVWEPYWSHCRLLSAVATLLSQVLRIDSIIAVPRVRCSATDEDSDDSFS